MNKMKVLITGASGMLGLKLSQVLTDNSFEVIAAYNSKNKFLTKIKGIKKISLDITSPESVEKVKKGFKKIDFIIHCAAITDVNKCELEKENCFSVNVTGTKNIVDLAKYYKASIIYISTPMIFEGKDGNYKEKSYVNPINYYAKTKLLGEKEVLKYQNGLIIRANPIGVRPPDTHPSFIQWFVNMAKNNLSFNLFSDVRINPISTATLSDIISKLILNFKTGILHLGSDDIVNKAQIWDDIVARFPNFSGKVTKITVDKTEAGKTAKRPKEMWLNTKKATLLGYKMPRWKKEINIVLKELNL